MKRFVIVSEREGVFVGDFLGMCFFSNLDPVGQVEVPVSPSREKLQTMVDKNPRAFPMKDISIKEIEVANDGYATIAECVQIGVRDWTSSL